QFRELAADLKDYGKPVMIRLNNEMNSDWTSYCGMVTLLDPEIFIETWRRMYNILREEGVDNVIWNFNPNAKSCPYSRWSEGICYFPGTDYVQLLGLTSYEMGNSAVLKSFADHYSELYEVNKVHFANWPMFIGEFACGAGGDSKGLELGRNTKLRTAWVRDMFETLSHKTEEGYEYCRNLVGAIWFNSNDYSGLDITNFLNIPHEETETWKEMRDGLAKINGQ
ncbi:MAG: hypothetical protein IJU16_04010, partial [Clostridia bacterium]|nr:hypothetical protein [Clostridia bacterium]